MCTSLHSSAWGPAHRVCVGLGGGSTPGVRDALQGFQWLRGPCECPRPQLFVLTLFLLDQVLSFSDRPFGVRKLAMLMTFKKYGG